MDARRRVPDRPAAQRKLAVPELKLAVEETRSAAGVLQVGGAPLALVPPATTIGAAVLGCTMAGAIVANLFILNTGLAAIIPAALLAAVVFVGWRSATASR